MPDEPAAPRLPGRTTPTWDMELLVSAASVFTLLQLPGWLDQGYFTVRARLDVTWDALFRILYTYGKLAILLLAAAFALHLAMRAYWIALVGMDSIYPQGIAWDRLRLGPRRLRFARVHDEPAANRIERADNRASIVFALGISMALLMVGTLVAVTLAYGITAALQGLFGWPWLMPFGAFALLGVVFLPYFAAFLADRTAGAKLAPDGRIARAIDAVYGAYGRVGYGRGGNPTLLLLQSHLGERRINLVTLLAVVACTAFAVVQLLLSQGAPALGDYARWPAADPGHADSLVAAHYRDQARGDTVSLLPTLDSAFPRGDYATLLVPFNPRRHPALLERHCAPAWRGAGETARRADLLGCFARWLDVRIDGKPVVTRPRYATDARTGQQAVALVLPMRGLAPGEHELRLRAPPAPTPRPEDPEAYRIVFWR